MLMIMKILMKELKEVYDDHEELNVLQKEISGKNGRGAVTPCPCRRCCKYRELSEEFENEHI